jgi:hypothetical protein
MNPFKNDLLNHVYCRIQASKIQGVGVFAIRPIPAGINPMAEFRTFEYETIPVAEINDDPDIPDSVKKLAKDMCPENGGMYNIPPFSLNEIGISYYLNHSTNPNTASDDNGDFYTLREIGAGEELTVDYGTYGALNLG